MTRPVWVQFHQAISLTSTGVSITDLLVGHLDQLQVSERTVVAVKGHLGLNASAVGAGPDILELFAGLIVGSDSLSAADFPVMDVDGLVNPGWMWRTQVRGVVSGNGTDPIQVLTHNERIDVRSKRSLQGLGEQTLWLVTDVKDSISVGSVIYTGQILLAQKG